MNAADVDERTGTDGQIEGSRAGTQLMFIASVLLLIIGFFNWQEIDFDLGPLGSGGAGVSAWDDIGGIIMGILTIVLIARIVARMAAVDVPIPVSFAMTSVVLGVLIFIIALLKNLTDNYSTWASYVGVVLALLVAVGAWLEVRTRAAWRRLKNEAQSFGGSGGGGARRRGIRPGSARAVCRSARSGPRAQRDEGTPPSAVADEGEGRGGGGIGRGRSGCGRGERRAVERAGRLAVLLDTLRRHGARAPASVASMKILQTPPGYPIRRIRNTLRRVRIGQRPSGQPTRGKECDGEFQGPVTRHSARSRRRPVAVYQPVPHVAERRRRLRASRRREALARRLGRVGPPARAPRDRDRGLVVLRTFTDVELSEDVPWLTVCFGLGVTVFAVAVVKNLTDAGSSWSSYAFVALAGVAAAGTYLDWAAERARACTLEAEAPGTEQRRRATRRRTRPWSTPAGRPRGHRRRRGRAPVPLTRPSACRRGAGATYVEEKRRPGRPRPSPSARIDAHEVDVRLVVGGLQEPTDEPAQLAVLVLGDEARPSKWMKKSFGSIGKSLASTAAAQLRPSRPHARSAPSCDPRSGRRASACRPSSRSRPASTRFRLLPAP